MSEVLGLSLDLRCRGIQTRVDVSDPDQAAGQPQYDALRRIIKDECDGFVLYVTKNITESACVWNVEIPAALDAFDHGRLSFIPIFRELSPYEASRLEPYGRRIAALGGVVLPGNADLTALRAGHVDAAKTILSAALGHHASLRTGHRIVIGLRTRDTGVDPKSVDLLLDWVDNYEQVFATGSPISDTLRAALADVRRSIAAAGFQEIHVVGPAHLSAGLAIGYTFPRPSGFRLKAAYEQTWWSAEGEEEPADLEVSSMQLDPGASDLILALALSRPEIVGDVDAAVGSLNLRIGGRVVFRPVSGPGRAAVRSSAHARGITRSIINSLMQVRSEWGTPGRTHVFMAAPLPLAVLLGHALNGLGPLRVYERTPDSQGYVGLLDL